MENKKGHINLITVLVFLAVLVGFVALGQALQNTSYSTNSSNNTNINLANSNPAFYNYSLGNLPQIYLIGSNGSLISSQSTTLTISKTIPKINISLIKSGKILNSTNLQNSTSFNLISSHFFSFNQIGDYMLKANASGEIKYVNFSIVQGNLTINVTQTKVNKKISGTLNVGTSPMTKNSISPIIGINYGDTPTTTGLMIPFPLQFDHTYSKGGNYTITAYLTMGNPSTLYPITKKIQVIAPINDTQKPVITMMNPSNGQVINSSIVNFSYKVTDNTGVGNCSFYLYDPNNNGIYNTPIVDYPSNNTPVYKQFSNFSDGTYSWDVTCYDDAGNFVDAIPNGARSFKVAANTDSYPYQSQIRQASSMLSNFTNQSSSYSPEQINALSDLGIMSNLTGLHGFAEQLNNIKQFFETNQSGFISNLNLRQKTINGEINELNYILSHIPQKVTVSDNQNFVKNSITRNMLGIANSFEISNGVILNEGEISNLALRNENLQRYITVSTNSRNVEVVYSNSTKEMTLVTKQIKITNSSYDAILEAFPENMSSDVTFLTSKNGFQVERINATIYEISQNYLNDTGGLLVYYITPPVDPSVITQSDTVLFKNFPASSLSITGFSILGLDGGSQTNYFIVIVMILLFIYTGVKIKKKVNLSKWKKDGNVVKVIEEIDRAKRALKNDNNTELAKESYHSIKNVFLLTPKGFRDYSRDEIDRIRKGIDRRDIINFVKEYEKAKMQGRKIDSERLYREIKITYKRLPKKDQERVYTKIFGSEWEL